MTLTQFRDLSLSVLQVSASVFFVSAAFYLMFIVALAEPICE
jgi:hypothetical protein